jgi:hypothetical protein
VTVKKLLKVMLETPPMMRLLHAGVRASERLGLGEPAMGRLYSGLVGIHIFRGFRSEL